MSVVGTRMALSYANLFMENMEEEVLKLEVYQPDLWLSLIDVTLLWTMATTPSSSTSSDSTVTILSNSHGLSPPPRSPSLIPTYEGGLKGFQPSLHETRDRRPLDRELNRSWCHRHSTIMINVLKRRRVRHLPGYCP